MSRKTDAILKQLRDYGLALPGTHLKSPWPGHKDLAVNDKTFAYLSIEGEPFSISCKLPQTSSVALMLPFCTPTAYGLGKSGWVSAQFPANEVPPPRGAKRRAKMKGEQRKLLDMLKAWIDESYRAQAPKKLLKQLAAAPISKSSSKKKPAAKPKRRARA
jgi:predicted DNA-binding protein (MmcQ/YjbR family)